MDASSSYTFQMYAPGMRSSEGTHSRFEPSKGQPVAVAQRAAEAYLGTLAGSSTLEKTLDSVWMRMVRQSYGGSPRAYKHTDALIRAFSARVFLDSLKVKVQQDLSFTWTSDYHFNEHEVLRYHSEQQGKGTFKDEEVRRRIKRSRSANPVKLGVIGSLSVLKKSYLLPYLYCGPNAKGQPLVYRVLGNNFSRLKLKHGGNTEMKHTGPRAHLMVDFLWKIGLIPTNTSPTRAGWHIAIHKVLKGSYMEGVFAAVMANTLKDLQGNEDVQKSIHGRAGQTAPRVASGQVPRGGNQFVRSGSNTPNRDIRTGAEDDAAQDRLLSQILKDSGLD